MPDDERAKLLERRAKLDARLKQLALQDQKQKRKDDTRRKIIAGALILEHAELKPEVASMLASLLNRYVTKPQDRALFEFLSDRTFDSAPLAADSFAAAAEPSSHHANDSALSTLPSPDDHSHLPQRHSPDAP